MSGHKTQHENVSNPTSTVYKWKQQKFYELARVGNTHFRCVPQINGTEATNSSHEMFPS